MKKNIIPIIVLLMIMTPIIAGAQTVTIGKFTPIVKGLFPEGGAYSFEAYVNLIIKIMIAFAGLMAVVVIVIAGLMYVTAGPNQGQTEKAKEYIWNAVIGLLIAVGFYIILRAINPALVEVNLGIKTNTDYTESIFGGGASGGSGAGGDFNPPEEEPPLPPPPPPPPQENPEGPMSDTVPQEPGQ